VLDLREQGISIEGTEAFADVLKVNTALLHLDLSWNDICNHSRAILIRYALCINKTLLSINLHCNSIGDQGARALANALNFNNTLSEIYLHGNEITKVDASVIADSLRCNCIQHRTCIAEIICYPNWRLRQHDSS
jgi:Ran GTPase-activating protein (RanGAP) involved in mRNA processing and transport